MFGMAAEMMARPELMTPKAMMASEVTLMLTEMTLLLPKHNEKDDADTLQSAHMSVGPI